MALFFFFESPLASKTSINAKDHSNNANLATATSAMRFTYAWGEDERPKRKSSHRTSGSERASHWPTEIARAIARWENEGGAVLKEDSVQRTMRENNV
jgi:hypothetical protein